jgi:hypothetical protein
MDISRVHKWEKATIMLLNMDGWKLEWCGGGFDHYDAIGETPKGIKCVVEMKFRQKYYESKMLERFKYDKLMAMDEEYVKLYFVNDPKGNYMFWLNQITMPVSEDKWCPTTTLWDGKKKTKEVYLLEESQATIINLNE